MRITKKQLQAQINRLNDLTGNKREPINDDRSWNIGTYCLSGAHGGWQLQQVCNDSGGVKLPLGNTGHIKARELSMMIAAFERGIELGKGGKQ